MFKVEDKVRDIKFLEYGEGIVKVRFQNEYLVYWKGAPKWRRITRKHRNEIIDAGSLMIPELEIIDAEIKRIEVICDDLYKNRLGLAAERIAGKGEEKVDAETQRRATE